MSSNVFEFTIERGIRLDSTLFRLQKGCVLQLRLGASLQSEWRSIRLFTEHPPPNWSPTPVQLAGHDDSLEDEGAVPKPSSLRRSSKSSSSDLVGEDERAARRAAFLSPTVPHKRLVQRPVYPLKFRNLHARTCASLLANSPRNCNCFSWDSFEAYAELHIQHAGSWLIFYTLDSSEKPANADGYLYVVVDPTLTVRQASQASPRVLPLDSIVCQTYISKQLGPLEQWLSRLEAAHETSYNMVHLTPLQLLGSSNSAYSIKDHQKLNPIYNNAGGKREATWKDVEAVVQKLESQWGMLSMSDLVLNHASFDSPWLVEHPECAYNLVNSPHLRPAFLVDRVIANVSEGIANGQYVERDLPAHLPHLKRADDDHWPPPEAALSEQRLAALRHLLHELLIEPGPCRIHEFYLMHVDDTVRQFRNFCKARGYNVERSIELRASGEVIALIQDPAYRRLKSTVDLDVCFAAYFDPIWPDRLATDDGHLNWICEQLRRRLGDLNQAKYQEVQSHLRAAIDCVISGVRYRFMQANGELQHQVTAQTPLVNTYFTYRFEERDLARIESLMDNPEMAKHIMACNGWVMNDDPLRNFADEGNNVYLRRELIVWGDSAKLRYGERPADCPFLWRYMLNYTLNTARIFHAIRLDNCHSTPIHVAEYMLERARRVRPELYVMGELFTGSDQVDNVFIIRLGITSLVREALSAPDSHEEGRLVYRYGGLPVGSFQTHGVARPLIPSIAHAILYDQTHDNPPAIKTRSVYDLLPSAALVLMACCASGSVRGYDEMVPDKIDVVSEGRLYSPWKADAPRDDSRLRLDYVSTSSGIIPVKRVLNQLHQFLGENGYNEVFVDQVNSDVVAVTRHSPTKRESYILVARTSFRSADNYSDSQRIPNLNIPGQIEEVVLEALAVKRTRPPTSQTGAVDPTLISTLSWSELAFRLELAEHFQLGSSRAVRLVSASAPNAPSAFNELEFLLFPPGSVVVFRVTIGNVARSAIGVIARTLNYGLRVSSSSEPDGPLATLKEPSTPRAAAAAEEGLPKEKLLQLLERLSLNDMNRVLFRSSLEEREDPHNGGAYAIPNFGELAYCGLQGIINVLTPICRVNDLGHPFCDNLRKGDWLMHYTVSRLLHYKGTRPVGEWLKALSEQLEHLPRYLIPCYFEIIISSVYRLIILHLSQRLGKFVARGSSFVRALGLGSLQLCSYQRSAPLPAFDKDLSPGDGESGPVTIAAGLPHFAVGIWRIWGRDTFISLPGFLLATERYDEARYLILAFAATLRHGLIPNLMYGGTHARYNARDAVWWWLYSIQRYCVACERCDKCDPVEEPVVPGIGSSNSPKFTPKHEHKSSILDASLSRLFPNDESEPLAPGVSVTTLKEVMQEALQRHADGVEFRERHAGFALDSHMRAEGFSNSVCIDWRTGFVFGGNRFNCGTWMDKMGSSDNAQNRGTPATPRDGAAVELVATCAATVRWLAHLSATNRYPYKGVTAQIKVRGSNQREKTLITFHDWHAKIVDNFERHFWIPLESDPNPNVPGNRSELFDCENVHEPHPELVNRRGIFRDVLHSYQHFPNYQLRPNFLVAMSIAPELFVSPARAWHAILMASEHLLGHRDITNAKRSRGGGLWYKTLRSHGTVCSLGMRTLDQSDWAYRPVYDNSSDSSDFYTSLGFNYHQGPEWLWLTGFYLRSLLLHAYRFSRTLPPAEGSELFTDALTHAKQIFGNLQTSLQTSPYKCLPELTNKDGSYCEASCKAQAWSVACLIEAFRLTDQLTAEFNSSLK